MISKKRQDYNYDCVIIGTGLGGLIAGAYLAKQGIKVLLCEQHSQPGGYLTSFTRKGYTFDGGIQALEDCGMLFSVLRQIGVLDRMEFKPSMFAQASPNGFYPFHSIDNALKYYDELITEYPHEAKGIKQIVEDARNHCSFMEAFSKLPNPLFNSFWKTLSAFPAWQKKYKHGIKYSKEFFRTLNVPLLDYLKQYLSDPDLIQLFSQMMYEGSPAAFMLIYHYFVMDYFHPKGGIQAFSDIMADYIIELGGHIRYKTLVDEIIIEHGRARAVKLQDGEIVRARFIISNSDARRTFLEMLPPEVSPDSYKQKLTDTPVSEAMFTVFLGVDIPAEELPVQGCQHVYFLPGYKGMDPTKHMNDENYFSNAPLEISIPSLNDPSLAPNGKSTIILQSFTYMEYADNWGMENGKRTERYNALKEKVTEQMIANAENIIPGLSQKIELKFSATPFTHQRYTLNSGGSTAGWTYDPSKSINPGAQGLWGFKTPVKNLYQAGHWTMSPGGIPACLTSAKMASSIIKWRMRLHMGV